MKVAKVAKRMGQASFAGFMAAMISVLLCSCFQKSDDRTPLEIVQSVADKIIRETSFDFKLVPQKTVLGIHFVDFRQTFGVETRGIAYALSYVISEKDTIATFGLSSSDAVKIWVDHQLVFRRADSRPAMLTEIAYNRVAFQDTFQVSLNRGVNKFLVKSASDRDQWIFFLRAMTPKGEENTLVRFSLDPMAAEFTSTDWLCIGPFESKAADGSENGLDIVFPPERETTKFYKHENRTFAWTIPKQNVLSELVIGPANSYKKGSYADWHYANGATMFGILTLADASGERQYREFVRQYCDFIVANCNYFEWQYESLQAFRGSYHRIFRRTMLDDTGAPALPFVELYLREETEAYGDIVFSIADYIVHRQMRLADSTFCRPEPVLSTVWADDLFMSVPFLLRMGEITGERSYFDDAALQVINFTKYLYDDGKGLFNHGWFSPTGETSPVFWGRANGWVVWAISEALTHLPREHADYRQILGIFQKHIAGLVKYQDPSGMWHQVLDHPESYEETSCTAMFVLGMARGLRHNWLDESYQENVLKGWESLKTKVDQDGTVHGICRGTGIGPDLDFYLTRATFDHDPRGLGAVITAGLEVSELLSLATTP